MKSLFEVSDPSEAKGAALDGPRDPRPRAARRIDQSLGDEPSVKAELSTTLGEVYAGLGVFQQGQALIQRNLALAGRRRRQPDAATRGAWRSSVAAGTVRRRDARSYRAALTTAQDPDSRGPDLMPRIYVGMGEAESGLEHDGQADRWVQKALAADLAALGPNHPDVARDLEALAVNDIFAARLKEGRARLERAVAIRRQAQGELHPKVSEDLMNLGSIAYLQRDSAAAETYYRRALRVATEVLGPSSIPTSP